MRRGVVPPALAAGAALSAMLFASRLPVTLDFILPRRAGWALFALAFEALSRPVPRAAFSAAVSLMLAAAFARFVWLAAAAIRGRTWTPRDFLSRGFAIALALLLARWSFSIWLEVTQKAWFPFGSLNVLEPAANLAVCSLIAYCVMAASLAGLSSRPAKGLLAWTAANALAALLAWSLYGAWGASPASEITDGSRRLFVVLTEEGGRPDRVIYDLPAPTGEASLEAAERALPRAGVHRLATLRALYEARAKLMDPEGLRRILMLGVKCGDELARSLLLDHLASAPPSPEALSALGALADETEHRVGPLGASRIALAYAHLGDPAQAAVWAKRAEAGPRGIPAGLLGLRRGGALEPGRVSGRVEGPRPLKVALYRKTDPSAPYLLDAAALAAAVEPDAKGRFSFSGLAAGRYYLAFAFPGEAPRGEIRVSGHRGDLALGDRTSLALPPLTITLPSR